MCQHAEGDPDDGSDHSDGSADVVVGNRPSRLAQPSHLPLAQNCNI